jgi:AcrR family transcriptional regulator
MQLERTQEIGTAPPRRPKRTQTERRKTARGALLEVARELFVERGFAGTGMEEIAERAGVSKGALYHHFRSKAAVFTAVVKVLDDELADKVTVAAQSEKRAISMLQRGAQAYIEVSATADVARIMADAPSVLGAEVFRAMNAESCIALLRAVLNRAALEGIDIPGDIDVVAAMFLGALNEAARLVATAPDRAEAANKVKETVDTFLWRMVGD